ncbi:hypothetical protein GCM10010151_11380 [Actinoallomurus spadix]|uniref:DUF397 domain-containing protein n=2 Tax=Actinoallomurus spadix TaxID=79912 RepID=A0ABP3FT98_9ACTN
MSSEVEWRKSSRSSGQGGACVEVAEWRKSSRSSGQGFRAGFTASTRILRSEFGIRFNVPLQGDRVVLGDEIDIGLEIQAVLADG